MARKLRKGKGIHKLRVDVRPSMAEIQKYFGHLDESFNNLQEIWPQMAKVIARHVKAIISSRGALLGETWADYSEEYAQSKGKGRAATLELEGDMLATVVSPSRGKAVLSMSRRALRYGVKGPQVRAIQFGIKGVMPPRKFIGVTTGMSKEINTMISEHVETLIERADKILGGGGRARAILGA